MVVVNSRENQGTWIRLVPLRNPPDVLKEVFEFFVQPDVACGIKRNNYYLFTVNQVFQYPPEKVRDTFYKLFMAAIHRATTMQYTHVMFALKK